MTSRFPAIWSCRYEISATVIVLVAWLLRVYRLDVLPPGLHHDEAIEGLNALEILSGRLRFWFPAGGGREPLFMYLTAGAIEIFGPTVFAIRILAASASTLLVATAYPLTRLLFDRRIALIATILTATSYWQIHTGRLGLRSSLLAPLAAIAAILLLCAARRSSLRMAAVAGAVLGLTIYSYFPARLLPVAFLALLLVGLRRTHRRNWIQRTFAFCGSAGVVAAPMLIFTFLNSSRANERVNEASVFSQSDPRAALVDSVLAVLGMFTSRGDGMWKYNLDSHPIFPFAIAIVFIAGLGMLFWRIGRISSIVVLVWIAAMILPSALATESPHFIRISGIAPIIFIVPALALAGAWTLLSRIWAPTGRYLPLALLVLCGALSAHSARDYFLVWARSPQTGPAFAADMTEAARMLRGLAIDKPVYLSNDPYEPRYLPVEYLASTVLAPGALHWFDGRRGLVLPDQPTIVIFPSSARPPEGFLNRLEGTRELGRNEHVEILEIIPPANSAVSIATFDRTVALIDAQLPRTVQRTNAPPDVLNLNLTWKLNEVPSEDLTIFVHIENEQGGWGSRDDRFYLTTNRLAGERVIAAFQVPIDAGAPPGVYSARLGVYRRDGSRLRTLTGDDNQTLGQFSVEPPDDSAAKIPADLPGGSLALDFPRGVRMAGTLIESDRVRPGQRLGIRGYWLNWRDAAASCRIDYVIRRGQEVLGQSSIGFMDRWNAAVPSNGLNQIRTGITMPPNTLAGTAEVIVSVCNSAPHTIGAVVVDTVTRSFERPTPALLPDQPIVYGSFARLIGYGIEGDWRFGGNPTLTLFWEVLEPSRQPLTVFIHLLDGATIVAQRDRQPVDGGRQTTSWVKGEYLVDRHPIAIPPGIATRQVAIAVGLYDSGDGSRVRISNGAGLDLGDSYQLPTRPILAP